MARQRSPSRDKAFELYKEHKGNITNREIANILGEDEKKVAVWKQRDKWNENNVVQQKKKSCTTKSKTKSKVVKNESVSEEVEEILNNTELNERQKLFCIYYIEDFKATKAYQKAYECEYESARRCGSKLLTNVDIKAEIDRLTQECLSEKEIDSKLLSKRLIQKYLDIAFAEITDFVEFGQEEVPVMGPFGPIEVKNDDGEKVKLTKIVNVVRFKSSSQVDGSIISEVKQGKDGASIKLQDKMKAMEWLSERVNLLPVETQQKLKLEEEKLKLTKEKYEFEMKNSKTGEGSGGNIDQLTEMLKKSAAMFRGDK